MKNFRCIHCGCEDEPESFIDPDNASNKSLMFLLVMCTMCTCCLGAPLLILYPFMAWRMHRCRDCGIKLG